MLDQITKITVAQRVVKAKQFIPDQGQTLEGSTLTVLSYSRPSIYFDVLLGSMFSGRLTFEMAYILFFGTELFDADTAPKFGINLTTRTLDTKVFNAGLCSSLAVDKCKGLLSIVPFVDGGALKLSINFTDTPMVDGVRDKSKASTYSYVLSEVGEALLTAALGKLVSQLVEDSKVPEHSWTSENRIMMNRIETNPWAKWMPYYFHFFDTPLTSALDIAEPAQSLSSMFSNMRRKPVDEISALWTKAAASNDPSAYSKLFRVNVSSNGRGFALTYNSPGGMSRNTVSYISIPVGSNSAPSDARVSGVFGVHFD